ncbi:LOW QUALITY PROTEIN: developmental pluripotency-associated protein 5A-like [Apodemus sylvaticus]|uniref:LOW QUALITY PROTEIN: developmental pluripotency-associated protein 5A-like n=1 Tax=Apodemus sylvaticus TaxID=10129 RepID=UPI00224192E4|nr:LOW QUALITY PROTEIN: developmental pluripotency-associated protein 5A-like [Apodemus sylvaticus]
MGTLVTREDISLWVKVPEDLKDPEVFFLAHTLVLKFLFGPQGSQMPHIVQVNKAMFELKILESSKFTEVLIYGSEDHKLRTKWMLQSMAERCHLCQAREILKLEEATKTLELGQCLEGSKFPVIVTPTWTQTVASVWFWHDF